MSFLRNSPEHISPEGPLEHAVPIQELPTPAILVDEARLVRNLRAMAALAGEAGVRLRPHAKSHKAPVLGRLQMDHGATGLCVAKVEEVEAMAGEGLDDFLVAYPVMPGPARRLARLAADRGIRVGATADSPEGIAGLAAAATDAGIRIDLWLELDVGLRRCGVDPEDPRLETLAREALAARGVRLRGLLTHAGQVYGARPGEVVAIGRIEGLRPVAAARRLEAAGLGPLDVGIGSTPTIPVSARVEGVTEIHPGVYVFGDRQQVSLGAMRTGDVSLTVLATVVSAPGPGRMVIDAGSKSLSSDRGAHGTEGVIGHGELRGLDEHRAADPGGRLPFLDPEPFDPGAFRGDGEPTVLLARLSEEHGVVDGSAALSWRPGERVEVMPNHACAVVNLAERIHVTRGEGEHRRAVASWLVRARGCVH